MTPRLAALALVLALPAAGAQAFHDFQGMQADQGLLQAIDQMAQTLGYGCQAMGVMEACNGYDMLMTTANRMAWASDACLQGNPQACQGYAQDLSFMAASYQSMTNAAGMAAGGGAGGMVGTPGYDPMNPLGATHDDRMNAIAGFGAAATGAYQDRSAQSDIAHNQFLDMIRQ
jgi:hypothetical protein